MTENPQNNPTRPVMARQINQAPPSGSPFKGILVLLFILGAMFFGCLVLAAIGGQGAQGPLDPVTKLREKTVESGDAQNKILLLKVEGVIMDGGGGGLFATPVQSPVKMVRDCLKKASDDQRIKAVVLRVDSPGGGVTASDQIYHEIVKFKTKSKKPVVVSMGGICASGGYYISAPADLIFAEETTITGSIGVILGGMNYSGLLEKYGVKDVSIKSGANKDLLNPAAKVRESHLKILQQTVDSMYARFVDIVSKGRKIPVEEIKAKNIADGRVFTSRLAKELKLVDKIGYLEDALEEAKKKVNAPKASVIEFKREATLLDILQAQAQTGKTVKIELPKTPMLSVGPRYWYIWRP